MNFDAIHWRINDKNLLLTQNTNDEDQGFLVSSRGL